MTTTALLLLVAGLLAAAGIIRSRGADLASWAVLILCIALAAGRL